MSHRLQLTYPEPFGSKINFRELNFPYQLELKTREVLPQVEPTFSFEERPFFLLPNYQEFKSSQWENFSERVRVSLAIDTQGSVPPWQDKTGFFCDAAPVAAITLGLSGLVLFGVGLAQESHERRLNLGFAGFASILLGYGSGLEAYSCSDGQWI